MMGAPEGTGGVPGVMTGGRLGINGAHPRAVLKAYAAFAILIAALDAANALSAVADRAALGRPIPLVEPAVWEASSGLAYLMVAPIAHLAVGAAPPRGASWMRMLIVHPAASVVFSALHVVGMSLIRIAAYALGAVHHQGRLFDFVYEYRKDVPAYLILAGLAWLFQAIEQKARAPAPAAATFDINDGARLIRSPVSQILAARAAGNYVEMLLADGRRPLVRSTLAAVQAALEPHGFVRTHRSWLVNRARVREFAPSGSGDFLLGLDGGAEVPLSRRYPEALQTLRTTPA